MLFMKTFTQIFLLFFFITTSVKAQKLTIDSSSIVQKILMGTGPISKVEYDEFWLSLGAKNQVQKQQMINSMQYIFITMQQHQKEVWNCAKEAWRTQKISPCQSARNVIGAIKKSGDKNKSLMAETLQENADNLIQAAANHSKYKMKNSDVEMVLSAKLIESSATNTDKMLQRFGQLLRVNY